jgi:hypothetical protein
MQLGERNLYGKIQLGSVSTILQASEQVSMVALRHTTRWKRGYILMFPPLALLIFVGELRD